MAGSSWVLTSNSGRESVRWTPSQRTTSQGSDVIVCDIDMLGCYFGATLGGDTVEPRDYTLVLRGLAIGVVELERVASFLESWLQLSIAEQATHVPALECSLGGLFDQSLTLALGRRDDILSGGKPVATFRYVVGRMTGELTFVTDQSCLRALCEGIRASLTDWTPVSHAS